MTLAGKRVAVLAEEGYEDLELWYPYYRLQEAGADVVLAAHEQRTYRSKHDYPVTAEVEVASLAAEDFDAVVIPGGVAAPDRMRRHAEILDFVREMDADGKIVAAICHAGWVPVSAGIVRGRTMTSYWSLKDDVTNAGGTWVDEETVVDDNLITARVPRDLPAFCRALIGSLTPE